jgi:hypothetical protein
MESKPLIRSGTRESREINSRAYQSPEDEEAQTAAMRALGVKVGAEVVAEEPVLIQQAREAWKRSQS